MCGFVVHQGQFDNSKIMYRGQDKTSMVGVFNPGIANEQPVISPYESVLFDSCKHGEQFYFIHNLLSITGEFTTQPFIDKENEIVCLYNGEIYNHLYEKSDGENIIPLYKKYGDYFGAHLDGEFAIALYDFKKRKVLFITDPFGTKPIYVQGVKCASYRSGIGGERMRPNVVRVQSMDSDEFTEDILTVWDWTNQYKRSYDDWINAFIASVRKRARVNCFIGLSSGYDSGAIACQLLKDDIDFKAYCFKGEENIDILNKRIALLRNYDWFSPLPEIKTILPERIDNEKYTILYDGKETTMHALDEQGIYGVATMCMLANAEGRKVTLSGHGADEIMSDYSFYKSQSELKGVFPKNLYMWKNFQGSCMESYLMKEEFGGGAFNIETRYPFLDKQVVQEFLWLHVDLKNKRYKAPLYEYLTRNKFPFDEGKKYGFGVNMEKLPPKPVLTIEDLKERSSKNYAKPNE